MRCNRIAIVLAVASSHLTKGLTGGQVFDSLPYPSSYKANRKKCDQRVVCIFTLFHTNIATRSVKRNTCQAYIFFHKARY